MFNASDFKYKDLTLKQLGIPEQDVLHVKASDGEYYIELCLNTDIARYVPTLKNNMAITPAGCES